MIVRTSKKVIFTTLLFINFIQPSNSAYNQKINKNKNLFTNPRYLQTHDNLASTNLSSKTIFKTNFVDKKFLNRYPVRLLAESSNKQKDIIIQSDQQSDINNVIFAEGNVLVTYRGKALKADNLIYDKFNKKITAKGNVELILGDQTFKVSYLEYSFLSKKGYLLNVLGSINTNTLMDDLSSNFSSSDSNKIKSLLEIKNKQVLHTPDKVYNWIFTTERIYIDGKKWKSN